MHWAKGVTKTTHKIWSVASFCFLRVLQTWWSFSIKFHLGGSCKPFCVIFVTVRRMLLALWLSEQVATWGLCQDADVLANGEQEIQVRMSNCTSAEPCLSRLPLSPVTRHKTAQVSGSLSHFILSVFHLTHSDMQHDLDVCNIRTDLLQSEMWLAVQGLPRWWH